MDGCTEGLKFECLCHTLLEVGLMNSAAANSQVFRYQNQITQTEKAYAKNIVPDQTAPPQQSDEGLFV